MLPVRHPDMVSWSHSQGLSGERNDERFCVWWCAVGRVTRRRGSAAAEARSYQLAALSGCLP